MQDLYYTAMKTAIDSAMSCSDDVRVGASIYSLSGTHLLSSSNRNRELDSFFGHAEILCLDGIGRKRLRDLHGTLLLAVTLEPCPMCMWAIRAAGIDTVVFGATNTHYGAAGSALDLARDTRFGRQINVISGILESSCEALLDLTFSKLRHN